MARYPSASASACAVALVLIWCSTATAEVSRDRFNAGGYFRIMTRPDFQGGNSQLGLWNLYGRLLNEGPWGTLELRLDLLQPNPGTHDVWTSVHTKIEGGSFANADLGGGFLNHFAVRHLYVQAGNILFDNVTWQLGTLEQFEVLGLYDWRIAQIFFETLGLAARYRHDGLDVLLGIGDSGYGVRGADYSTILTGGGWLRYRFGEHVEAGVGGQVFYEPAVRGNRNAPHATALPQGVTYEDYYRGETAQRFLELNPGQGQLFPDPTPVSNTSYKAIAHFGFGGFGVLRWNSLYASYRLAHPDNVRTETAGTETFDVYLAELTDERIEVLVGNEMQLRLVPDLLDVAWGAVFGYQRDLEQTIAAGEDNRTYYSTVLRAQYYLSETFHILVESSVAQERSLQGNLWREHFDSIFTSQNGATNTDGLEYGDTATRNTWQLKAGVVLNPTGPGIYTRPSIRVLYGVQFSNVHNAFGSAFVTSLDQFDTFGETADRHWHHLIALEAEGWF